MKLKGTEFTIRHTFQYEHYFSLASPEIIRVVGHSYIHNYTYI